MNGEVGEHKQMHDPHCSRVVVDRATFDQEHFDREFDFVSAKPVDVAAVMKRQCRCSKERVVDAVLDFVPILRWLPKYKFRRDLIHDVVAGLTVGIMHIPQGMAYAGLAGLLPVYGLYTSFFPAFFYMFFGTSRHVSLGVFAVVSLMVGSVRLRVLPGEAEEFIPGAPSLAALAVGDNLTTARLGDNETVPVQFDLTPVEVVTSLTLAVGLCQLVMGILHLGFLTAYLSDQVISGFTTGAACHVFTAQINKILGVKLPRYSGPGRLFKMYADLFGSIGEASWETFVLSVATMILLFIGKEFVNPPFKRRFRIPIPWELVVVILGTGISAALGFQENYHMKVVDHIPTGLPAPKIPRLDLIPQMLTDAVGIAIVIFVVTVSMGKLFAKKHYYRIDPGQELYALAFMECISSLFSVYPASLSLARSLVYEAAGARSQELYALAIMECLCSLFRVYPACLAFSRSLIFEGAGGKSQLATVFSCGLLLVVLLWLGPLFQALPMCILGSIIIVALKGMFMQVRELKTLWPVSKIDFSIWLVSFLATVCLDVREGLAVSVIFALFTVILRSQRPHSLILGRIMGTDLFRNINRYKEIEQVPGVKIFRFDSPLIFTNTELFRTRLFERTDVDPAEARLLLKKWRRYNDNKLINGEVEEAPTKPLNDVISVAHSTNIAGEQVLRPLNYPGHIILDCTGFNSVDFMGVVAMRTVFDELDEVGVRLLFSGCKAPVRDMLERFGFFARVPKHLFFPSNQDAVAWTLANRDCSPPLDDGVKEAQDVRMSHV